MPPLPNRTIGDFRNMLDRLKADGFYLFQANLIETSDVAARTPKDTLSVH
jgi:hypothetical protein